MTSIIRRSVRWSTLAAVVVIGYLVFGGSTALAAPRYGLVGSFGSASSTPVDPQPLSVPAGVAVSKATEDVYVVDQGNDRVEMFASTGAYLSQFNGSLSSAGSFSFTKLDEEEVEFAGLGDEVALNGIAVDNSTSVGDPSKGDVYVVDSGHDVIDKFTTNGEYLSELKETTSGTFGGVAGVAVDREGNVWVLEYTAREAEFLAGEPGNGHVDEFNDEGAYVGGFDDEYVRAHGVAVNAEGNVYVARGLSGGGEIEKWTLGGSVWSHEPFAEPNSNPTGIAADAVTGDVYAFSVDRQALFQYDPLGGLVQQFGERQLVSGSDLSVNTVNQTVYVADAAGGVLDVYALGEPPEAPITEAATTVTPTSALLHGTLAPPATKLRYQFEYNTGASCVGGAKTAPKESEGAVSAELTGLQPGTPYAFCLVAENAFGRASGRGESFRTPPAVEGVSKCTVSGVTGEAATLKASLEPKGAVTEYQFQYGTTLPGPKTKVKTSAVSVGVETDSEPVTRLEPNRSYECQLLATREIEGKPYTTQGEIGTFKTSALAPVVIDESTSNVGLRSAGLHATIDPENSTTTYYIEYVEAVRYCPTCADPYDHGARIPDPPQPEGEVGSDIAYHTVQQTAQRLAPGTTYDYRVVTTNSPELGTGTSYGESETFTTGTENPPVALTGAASDLTQTGAVVSGTVDPEGYATNYVLELGTTSGYGTQISGPAGSGTQAQPVNVALQGLAPGTTYHYRVTAVNRYGTSYGADGAFTTATYNFTYSLTPPLTPALVPAPTFATIKPPMTTPTSKRALTRGQKLKKALKACRAKRGRKQRAACESSARKRYTATAKAKKTKH